jgi:hypothetical protein
VAQFGPNALGEVLEPGRITDCYLGLLLPPGPAGEPEAGTVLIVAPAAPTSVGCIPPAAADPATGSCSHRTRRVTPDAAARPRVSGTWTASRTAIAAVSAAGTAAVPGRPPR